MIETDANEKIILRVRRHKLVLILEALFLLFFVVLPPIIFWLTGQAFAVKGSEAALFGAVYSAILLVAWVIFFIFWSNYYLDVLVVTDRRIIDIEQRGFFNREVSTVRLDKIEDITVNVTGVLATFLDYGTIRLQTAAESREFIIRDIPHPNNVKSVIYDLHNQQLDAPQSVKMIQ